MCLWVSSCWGERYGFEPRHLPYTFYRYRLPCTEDFRYRNLSIILSTWRCSMKTDKHIWKKLPTLERNCDFKRKFKLFSVCDFMNLRIFYHFILLCDQLQWKFSFYLILMFRVYLFVSFMLSSGVQYVQLMKIRTTRAQYKDYEMLTKEFSHKESEDLNMLSSQVCLWVFPSRKNGKSDWILFWVELSQ